MVTTTGNGWGGSEKAQDAQLAWSTRVRANIAAANTRRSVIVSWNWRCTTTTSALRMTLSRDVALWLRQTARDIDD